MHARTYVRTRAGRSRVVRVKGKSARENVRGVLLFPLPSSPVSRTRSNLLSRRRCRPRRRSSSSPSSAPSFPLLFLYRHFFKDLFARPRIRNTRCNFPVIASAFPTRIRGETLRAITRSRRAGTGHLRKQKSMCSFSSFKYFNAGKYKEICNLHTFFFFFSKNRFHFKQ